jgi:hypothetical protein
MKKMILVSVLAIGVYQLKAQQLLQTKPADSLSKFEQQDLSNPVLLTQLNPNLNESLALIPGNLSHANLNSETFYSRMPVAVLNGHDNMPVLKHEGTENMPVLIINPVDPIKAQSAQGLPAFKAPVKPSPVPKN